MGFAETNFAEAGFAEAGFAEADFAEAGFAEADFAEAGFTKETDGDDDDDSIVNDFIGDSEGEMEGGESFSMKRKKLHFCKKIISGCESSLLNLNWLMTSFSG